MPVLLLPLLLIIIVIIIIIIIIRLQLSPWLMRASILLHIPTLIVRHSET